MKYDTYEWKISPKSSFLTEIESDILFGHFIWAMKYIEGEEFLKEKLNEYKNGNPPFIFSNGFLNNEFPFLKKINLSIEETKEFAKLLDGENNKMNQKNVVLALKKLKKYKNVNREVFEELLGEITEKDLYIDIFKMKRDPMTLKKYEDDIMDKKSRFYAWTKGEIQRESKISIKNIMKNKINRLNNGTEQADGTSGLFSDIEKFYNSNVEITIFIKIRDDIKISQVKKYLNYIEDTGYGKKKNIGKGNFKTISFDKIGNIFGKINAPNGFMVLSNYIPIKQDFSEIISGDIMTKRGKLGGDYSHFDKPFKKPIVMYKPGSLFKGEVADVKGQALENIHYNKDIFQYGFGFCVGVKI